MSLRLILYLNLNFSTSQLLIHGLFCYCSKFQLLKTSLRAFDLRSQTLLVFSFATFLSVE
jgi:hypothetical protein